MKEFLGELFTYKGRWNRLKFWLYPLAFFVVIVPMILLIAAIGPLSLHSEINQLAKYNSDKRNLEQIIGKNTLQGNSINELESKKDYKELVSEIEKFEQQQLNGNNSSDSTESLIFTSFIFIGLLYVLSIYITITTYIKRLRDLDKSPWMVLLLLVPFVNLYLWILCGFFKGTQGPNQYGPDPLGAKASDNTL
ncbi:MAG: DUF805 domain-containing protein [Candidatus Gracilibacteria bacterium]|nr:DUF805 domain-containing protein [Candidatus Gracilibacteria bacterium]